MMLERIQNDTLHWCRSYHIPRSHHGSTALFVDYTLRCHYRQSGHGPSTSKGEESWTLLESQNGMKREGAEAQLELASLTAKLLLSSADFEESTETYHDLWKPRKDTWSHDYRGSSTTGTMTWETTRIPRRSLWAHWPIHNPLSQAG